MQALQIEFTFQSAVSPPDTALHLDGLLAYAQVQRNLKAGQVADDIATLGEDLPLAKIEQDGEWSWQASMLMFQPAGDAYLQFITRKTEIDAIAQLRSEGRMANMRAAQVNLQSGRLRNFTWFYPLQQMEKAIAYAVGERDAVEDLLMDIHAIGKKHEIGNGIVASCTVRAAATPAEDIAWRSKALYRFLPFQWDGYAPVQGAARAPYWRLDRRRIVWAPME